MLEKFFDVVKRPAKWGMVGSLLLAAFIALLINAGNLGGGFMPVISGLIVLVIEVAIWACVPVFLFLKNEEWAKKAFVLVSAYWYVTSLLSFFESGTLATGGVGALWVAYGVFAFLIGLIFLAAIVLYVLGAAKKSLLFEKTAFCTFACSIVFLLVAFALRIAIEAKIGADWTSYFEAISFLLVLPMGMFFGTMYFFPPKEEKTASVAPATQAEEESQAETEPSVTFEEAKAEAEPTVETTDETEETDGLAESAPIAEEETEEASGEGEENR